MAKRRKPKKFGSTLIQKSRAVAPSDKAYFQHVSGVGKSRTKRRFFGLSDKEEARIQELVGQRISVNLRAEG